MTIQEIKKAFYARRNGVVADRLRSAGDPHHYIMGCTLIEVLEVSRAVDPGVAIAERLWADRRHRECRLMAPMIFPVEEFSQEKAIEWVADVLTVEEADNLCHKLLRNCDFAPALVERLLKEQAGDLAIYTAYRLWINLIATGKSPAPDEAAVAALRESADAAPMSVRQAISTLIEWNAD